MAATAWSHKPTLTGPLVTLRPYREEDLPRILSALADPDLQRLTGGAHSTDEAHGAEIPEQHTRQWYASRADQRDRLDLMVVDNTTGQWVGEVVLNQWDEGNESCNFRILLGPDGRDRGLGSEATRMLVDYAFTHLPLHRIWLGVFEFNPRARRVYEKAGFVVEGRERDALRFDGERIDQVMMSVLRPEWEQQARSPNTP